MAEASFKQMISLAIRQTRPQSFRSGKPQRYPQRRPISTSTAIQADTQVEERPQWQVHTISAPPQEPHNRPRLQKLRTENEPRSFSSFLTDNYAREHNYLRISVTERCNLRCLYCMPEEGVALSPPAHLLTTPEIVHLSSIFVNQGVDKIRLTGGEPTVRKDILDLMHQIGQLRSNGLKELCITTNGISLHRKLDKMVESGLTGVNLSLDTLDPYQFTIMTRRNGHDAVMKSITRILEMNKHGAGIKLKINCVVMRGINEREIVPFVEMGKEQDLEVRFIEYMPFDGNKWSEQKMLSFKEMLALIQQKYPNVQKVQDHANDTSKTYKVPGFVGRIGFITSMTHNFCGTCNRLRITGDGNLKVCLFGNSEVSLRDILRESNNGQPIDEEAMEAIKQIEMNRREGLMNYDGKPGMSDQEAKLLDVIGMAVKRKKEKHAGIGELENMKNRPMILIDDIQPSQSLSNYTKSTSTPALITKRKRLSSNYSNIPHHLLTTNTQFSVSQTRSFSSYIPWSPFPKAGTSTTRTQPWRGKETVRKVIGASNHRNQQSNEPETIPAFSWGTWSEIRRGLAQDGELEAISLHVRQVSNMMNAVHRSRSLTSKTENLDDVQHFSGLAKRVRARTEVSQDTSQSERHLSTAVMNNPTIPAVQGGRLETSRSTTIHTVRTPLATASRRVYTQPIQASRTEEDLSCDPVEAEMENESRLDDNQPHKVFDKMSTMDYQESDDPLRLSHLNEKGEAHMVSIAGKKSTSRSATATSTVLFSQPTTYTAIVATRAMKGDAVAVARIAGIQAAKKTADLIPLAHPGLGITGIRIDVKPFPPTKATDDSEAVKPDQPQSQLYSETDRHGGVDIVATVACEGKTGVEMEALTAANVSALTMYDMLKGIDKGMVLTGSRVIAKKGGKSGDWTWDYTKNDLVRETHQNIDEMLKAQRDNIRDERIRMLYEEKQRKFKEYEELKEKEMEGDVVDVDRSGWMLRVDKEDLDKNRGKRWQDWESR